MYQEIRVKDFREAGEEVSMIVIDSRTDSEFTEDINLK